jgi:hypothetical protein
MLPVLPHQFGLLKRRRHQSVGVDHNISSAYWGGGDKAHFRGWRVDWAVLGDELARIAELAAELGVWIVAGAPDSWHYQTAERYRRGAMQMRRLSLRL